MQRWAAEWPDEWAVKNEWALFLLTRSHRLCKLAALKRWQRSAQLGHSLSRAKRGRLCLALRGVKVDAHHAVNHLAVRVFRLQQFEHCRVVVRHVAGLCCADARPDKLQIRVPSAGVRAGETLVVVIGVNIGFDGVRLHAATTFVATVIGLRDDAAGGKDERSERDFLTGFHFQFFGLGALCTERC